MKSACPGRFVWQYRKCDYRSYTHSQLQERERGYAQDHHIRDSELHHKQPLMFRNKTIRARNEYRCGDLKGNSHQKLSVSNRIELLVKSFLVYHSPMFEAWKLPKRPVEVSCDVVQYLVTYNTALGTRTNISGMRTHTGQHLRLPCMHTPLLLD